jgi:hypothetical protein
MDQLRLPVVSTIYAVTSLIAWLAHLKAAAESGG